MNTMIKHLLFILGCFITLNGFGQSKFISKGKIEFEKKTNLHASLEGEGGEFAEQIKKQIPQYITSYFDLIFSANRAIYKPGKEGDKMTMWGSPASENIVFSDFA